VRPGTSDPTTKARAVGLAATTGVGLALGAALLARRSPLAGGLALAIGSVATWGAFARNSPVFGAVTRHGNRRLARASLTFDDGPGPSTQAILDALECHGARATFFVLGRQVERYPDIVRRIAADGHQIASHGYDHGILVFRGARHVADQLRRTENAVAAALGRPGMTPWFRAPHGFRGPLSARAVNAAGYRTAGWSTGVWDSADPGVQTIADRTTAALHPGAVVLLHDADGWAPERRRDQTAQALPTVIEAARARGLELVTLAELAAS
jgi:peptidoglycan-N-acetylglucosamine deacetylase